MQAEVYVLEDIAMTSADLNSLINIEFLCFSMFCRDLSKISTCIAVLFFFFNMSPADTKGCKISVDAATSLGKPQYNNQPRQPTYSCTPGSSSSSQYEVHVLSVYEVISRRPPTAGDATVNIFSGGRSDRPLVLVLASYEPVNWILRLPSDVTISRVILVGRQQRQLYDK